MGIKMRRLGLGLVLGCLPASGVWAQGPALPRDTGDRTQPPQGATVVVTAAAKGVQIYRCEMKDGAAQWVFVAPEASLYEGAEATGPVMGRHGAGPVWRWKDGSAVLGTLLEKRPSPEADAVPWLLLRASAVPGSSAGGQLKGVAYVRRAETHGGAAPSGGCAAGQTGGEARVSYTATYTFYRAGE